MGRVDAIALAHQRDGGALRSHGLVAMAIVWIYYVLEHDGTIRCPRETQRVSRLESKLLAGAQNVLYTTNAQVHNYDSSSYARTAHELCTCGLAQQAANG